MDSETIADDVRMVAERLGYNPTVTAAMLEEGAPGYVTIRIIDAIAARGVRLTIGHEPGMDTPWEVTILPAWGKDGEAACAVSSTLAEAIIRATAAYLRAESRPPAGRED